MAMTIDYYKRNENKKDLIKAVLCESVDRIDFNKLEQISTMDIDDKINKVINDNFWDLLLD